MKAKQTFRTLFVLALLSLNVGCDQISKGIARQKIEYHEQITLIKNYITLTKTENAGAFWSAGHNLPEPTKTLILTISPLIILIAGFVYVLKMKNLSTLAVCGICFVIGGGVGNIYDRIQYGSVTDFLHINLGVFQTGIFNMADVSITTGTCMILVELFRRAAVSTDSIDDKE